MDDDQFYEPTEQDIERELNRSGPPTIEPPTPSDRTDKIVEWLTDPAVMLVDLTETLNQILSVCRWRYFDRGVRELIPEKFKDNNQKGTTKKEPRMRHNMGKKGRVARGFVSPHTSLSQTGPLLIFASENKVSSPFAIE